MSCWIYVLKCQGGRYYVGKTIGPVDQRINDHLSGNGSEWTRRFQPIEVVEKFWNENYEGEDSKVKEYMRQYGIDFVRGGSYSQIELPEYKLRTLEDEFKTIDDVCFRCGRPGHFVGTCYAKTNVDGAPLDREEIVAPPPLKPAPCFKKLQQNSLKEKRCQRCLREGHSHQACYAKKTMDGHELPVSSALDIPASFSAPLVSPPKKKIPQIKPSSPQEKRCQRCQREGHTQSACYAKKTLDGTSLSQGLPPALVFVPAVPPPPRAPLNTKKRFRDSSPPEQRRQQTSSRASVCYRCGRDSHYANDCYASFHANGDRLDD
jgi:predicted GIY-YIG superfamily endonuclease